MIALHTTATSNGYKASIMLEEVALPYRVHAYDLAKGEHLAPSFLALNPVGRVPTLVDDTVDGPPVSVYGTAAICYYLADKTGRLLPAEPDARAATHQWVGIVSSDIAPAYSGQFTFNILAPQKLPWAIDYYNRLCDRLLGPLEARLASHRYLAGERYTIADILAYPVAAVSMLRYPGSLQAHPQLARWSAEVGARPAVQRGMRVPA